MTTAFHYLYQITNTINGNIYVGVHKTTNMDDGYMGSGTALRRAFFKYGITNFRKDIISTFETSENMYQAERLHVNEIFVNRADTYNCVVGGCGGFEHLKESQFKPGHSNWLGKKHTPDAIRKMRRPKSPEARMAMSVAAKHHIGPSNNFYGKTHTTESRLLMSEKALGHKRGVGRVCSEETKKKMSESARARCLARKINDGHSKPTEREVLYS